MSGSVKEIMLVGSDGARPQIVDRMGQKGLLLNFAELMERETFIHALNPCPTITMSNWTTLSTGGVTDNNVHHPGESLDRIYSASDTSECSVEHIWDAAEKIGKKRILAHYETSWLPTLKNGIVVGGCGRDYQTSFTRSLRISSSPPALVPGL